MSSPKLVSMLLTSYMPEWSTHRPSVVKKRAAYSKAGFEDGAHPVWQQESADRDTAIQTVVHNAWAYWVRTTKP